ncbi:TfoX-like protein [Dongia mobilis]|uniref:TfoX-like protein n=1 Tax=Dongia mobilis TaxID=578943 RepID=A0A4R6WKE9_9PROT|nr:TfoX/Sxy family protein [Dongia mobilis]TDQ81033.1 TfoX-like protein [Dongia mobilis]
MSTPLGSLKNIGPATIRQLQEVGIADADALRSLGAVATYRRLKHAFPDQVTLTMAYALEGALLDCHWNRLPPERREYIRSTLRGA